LDGFDRKAAFGQKLAHDLLKSGVILEQEDFPPGRRIGLVEAQVKRLTGRVNSRPGEQGLHVSYGVSDFTEQHPRQLTDFALFLSFCTNGLDELAGWSGSPRPSGVGLGPHGRRLASGSDSASDGRIMEKIDGSE
jgi:hypothetical protein